MSKREHAAGDDAEPEPEAKRAPLSDEALWQARTTINRAIGSGDVARVAELMRHPHVDTLLNDERKVKPPLGLKSVYNPLLAVAGADITWDTCRAMLDVLVSAGANVNYRDCDGNTILHAMAPYDSGHLVQIVQFLLERGADINARAGFHQHTPLHTAIVASCVSMVDVLIAAGSDCNARTAHGQIPLGMAVLHDAQSTVDILLLLAAGGADANGKWETPSVRYAEHLFACVRYHAQPRQGAVVRALLFAGAPADTVMLWPEYRVEFARIVAEMGGADGVARARREWLEALPDTSVAKQRWLAAQPGRRTKAAR